MRKVATVPYMLILTAAIALLFMLNLLLGTVRIPFASVFHILMNDGSES